MRQSNRYLWLMLIFLIAIHQLPAQVNIPTTSGFGGYFLTGPGIFNVKSNLLVAGPPLTGDVGEPVITSIFDSPDSNTSLALPVAGELNYTFAESKTQLFFGNGLEDILRLDVPVGIGVRHQLNDTSLLTLRILTTPLKLKFWEDPYIENEERIRTYLNFPGVRFRWSRMFRTGLEFTTTIRKYIFDNERSGDWLISEGRLDPSELSLLSRNGFVYRFRLVYQIKLDQKHILRPGISYINDDHRGAAIANQGYALKLNYLRLSKKFLFDANVRIGKRYSSADHPVYDDRIDAFRFGAAVSAFIPIKFFNSNRWNIWLSADYMTENSRIDFFDSSLVGIMGGLMYRYNRK